MAGKSSQPALYEKMRARLIPVAPAPAPAPPKAEITAKPLRLDAPSSSWLSPGRVLRLPVGYVLLACGVAIVLAALAYMVGYQRGFGFAKSDFEQHFSNGSLAGVNDPLSTLEPLSENGTGGKPGATGSSGPRNEAGAFRSTAAASWGQVVPTSDPRKKGLNYFVLIETTESGARQLAEFCRANGLETYVVPVNNKPSVRRVVAFPGFDLSVTSADSSEIKTLKGKIWQVGEKWAKEKKRPAENLEGTYLSRYDG